MAASIPTTEPSSLRAGDTWQWRREDLADYPASAWTLVYYFRNASAHFDITASADGDAYAVTVAKASSGKAPGWYDWIAVVSSATERHEVDRGRLEILPDYATAAVLDGRSTARRILEAIDALILGRASADQVDTVAAAVTHCSPPGSPCTPARACSPTNRRSGWRSFCALTPRILRSRAW